MLSVSNLSFSPSMSDRPGYAEDGVCMQCDRSPQERSADAAEANASRAASGFCGVCQAPYKPDRRQDRRAARLVAPPRTRVCGCCRRTKQEAWTDDQVLGLSPLGPRVECPSCKLGMIVGHGPQAEAIIQKMEVG